MNQALSTIQPVANRTRLLWPNPDQITRLREHQREKLKEALKSRISILSGTPGTGKSFVAGELIKAISNQYGGHTVAVAAPTGKAAVRISEFLSKSELMTQATTMHRLLEVGRNGHDQKGWGFQRNRFNKLTQQFFFIDEFSMCDTDLCAAFFAALPDESHVLLIGDPYQLPPVGHGAPLRDLIDSGSIGFAELTEVHRNAGDIVLCCKHLKDGVFFRPNLSSLDPDNGKNWLHCELKNPAAQIAKLQHLLHTMPPQWNKISDVQVICALNTKGDLCRNNLNQLLQQQLNPSNPIEKNRRFAPGDKVICVRTCKLELVETTREHSQIHVESMGVSDLVSNGESGRVLAMDKKQAIVRLLCPRREVAVPLSGGEDGSANAFDLGYAITCHKAQGSQMPIIIEMIDDSHGAHFVTSREWHYTAISRAERMVLTLGKWEALMRQSKLSSLKTRKTRLQSLMQEGLVQ